jgi:antagonist of KipI
VHAVGFTPGFPYLGGLAPKLATPRRATPRTEIAAGSVGIGGAQTGVYSVPSPAGWNIIGCTPLALFDPRRAEPALLRPGDRVTFRAIGPEAFREQSALEKTDAQVAAAETLTAGIEVRRAGMFTSVQDLGRPNFRGVGVPVGGAADSFALRIANLLVRNPESAAGLEFTLVGPEIVFLHDTVVALTGAEFSDWPRWQPVRVRTGTRLELGAARSGCRGYLAIAGGIDVPPVLGSRSTQVRAQFGGVDGRVLRDGDVLPVPHAFPQLAGRWRINERILPRYAAEPVLRVVVGAEREEFDDALFTNAFTVTSQSDRMGVRLAGCALARGSQRELVSCAVAPGTIQVPPDGNPIVLLADAQTIGGYPQLAHVIAVDLPVAAQLRPGNPVRFQEVTLAEAHELLVAREHALAILREGLAQKVG